MCLYGCLLTSQIVKINIYIFFKNATVQAKVTYKLNYLHKFHFWILKSNIVLKIFISYIFMLKECFWHVLDVATPNSVSIVGVTIRWTNIDYSVIWWSDFAIYITFQNSQQSLVTVNITVSNPTVKVTSAYTGCLWTSQIKNKQHLGAQIYNLYKQSNLHKLIHLYKLYKNTS